MPKNANQKNKLVNSVNLYSQKAIMVSITVQLWSIYFLLILKLLSTNQYQLLLTCDSNFATNMLLKPTLFTLLALCGCKVRISSQYSELFQRVGMQQRREDKSEQLQNECHQEFRILNPFIYRNLQNTITPLYN